jgi:hypothetical protein
VFLPGNEELEGFVIHPPRDDQPGAGDLWPADSGIALVRTEHDDIHIVPGRFVTTDQRAFEERLRQAKATAEPEPERIGDLFVYTMRFEGIDRVQNPDEYAARSVELLTRLAGGLGGMLPDDEEQLFAPLYGFVAHQTSHPVDDPEAATRKYAKPADGADDPGTAINIVVIDTGRWLDWAWLPGAVRAQALPDDIDPLYPPVARGPRGPFLGRAAGHGTFIGGLLRQVVPGATLTFLRAVDTEGLVHELRFAKCLELAIDADPDLVVICSGGTMYHLAPPPANPAARRRQHREWLQPLVLKDALQKLLAAPSSPVVVMSAGNDGSREYSFPAAYADPAFPSFQAEKDRLVSVAALDRDNWRACFSNYGTWVTASALGVRLQATFVPGREDPRDDPDGHPNRWTGKDPWAMWSGTSFATPIVAGMIARTLWALRNQPGAGDPVDAWRVLRSQCAEGPEGDITGVVVPAPSVLHA